MGARFQSGIPLEQDWAAVLLLERECLGSEQVICEAQMDLAAFWWIHDEIQRRRTISDTAAKLPILAEHQCPPLATRRCYRQAVVLNSSESARRMNVILQELTGHR